MSIQRVEGPYGSIEGSVVVLPPSTTMPGGLLVLVAAVDRDGMALDDGSCLCRISSQVRKSQRRLSHQ